MKYLHLQPCRRFLALAAIAVISLQAGCRSAQRLPGQWLAIPPEADGRLDDFSKKITSHLFENGMMVGVGNDDRWLYIFFSPDIRHRQRLPGRATLTLWLDEEGGKARKLGLAIVSGRSPSAGPGDEERPDMKREGRPEPAGRPGSPPERDGSDLIKIIDRRSGKEILIAADGSLGPTVRLTSDWGDFTYQLRIPIQGSGDWPGMSPHPGRAIGIGLQWEIESPRVSRKNRREGPGGGPGEGGPGMGRAGMEGAPPGRGNGPEGGIPGKTVASKRKVWLKILLADQS